MGPELFTIRRAGPGALSTMARPAGGASLAQAMDGLAAAGVSVLVSLLTDAEMADLGLTAEAEAARAAGITFYRLPTPDRHVPHPAAGLELASMLRAHLADGAGVAVHCRYGIGRSSTLAAMVLVLEGAQPRQAWAMISAARGMTVPDTAAQLITVLRMQDLQAASPAAPGTVPPGTVAQAMVHQKPGDETAPGLVENCPDTAHP
jgi:protein-tyrosine phosphatase